jgi:transcriptional regulator with PAS, ATPase and Fis domain
LDEIGDTPLVTQGKLLRVLQDQEVQRVGSPARRKVDVRVIAATNRNLETLVDEKLFRDDLYFRLSMVEIKLPPLSERKEDLHLLERYFIEQFSERYHKQIKGLTRRAQALLSRHSWPGNIRDLENALGHACMMAEGNILDVRDFPDRLRAPTPKGIGEEDESLSLEALQRRHALRVLERLGGNKARAAEVLGVSRTTLYRLLAEARSEQSGQTPLADS